MVLSPLYISYPIILSRCSLSIKPDFSAESRKTLTVLSSIVTPIGNILLFEKSIRDSDDINGITLLSGNLKCLIGLQTILALLMPSSFFHTAFPLTSVLSM